MKLAITRQKKPKKPIIEATFGSPQFDELLFLARVQRLAKNYATQRPVSPKMQIKKSYLCDIFRHAWKIKKSENIAFSQALKKAWAFAKKPKNKKKFKSNQTVLL